jgi:hypothetical protein
MAGSKKKKNTDEPVGLIDGEWLRELKAGGAEVQVGPVPAQDGIWMSRRDDSEPTVEEHDGFYPGLSDCLEAAIGEDGAGKGAAYIRGDFFSDRSEEMYVYGTRFVGRLDVLAAAVRAVQRHLGGQPRWRVILPLGEGPDFAMVIYPEKIFYGAQELDEAALATTLDRYVSFSTSRAKEKRVAKQARLDAVAPLLRAALERVRATNNPVFVADVMTDDGPGVWVVHPDRHEVAGETDGPFEPDGYLFEPDCYQWEVHTLDSAGGLRADDAEPPAAGGGLLVLWAPAERGPRTIRMTRGDFTARWTLGQRS